MPPDPSEVFAARSGGVTYLGSFMHIILSISKHEIETQSPNGRHHCYPIDRNDLVLFAKYRAGDRIPSILVTGVQ